MYKQGRKRPIPVRVKPDSGSSWEDYSGRMGAGVKDGNTESCGVVHPFRIPLAIRPLRRMYVVVVIR